MVSKKAVDMANLRLAMSENNKKVKECVQSSEKTLQNQVDELKESAVTPEEKASWKNQNAFSAIVVEGTKVKAQDIADTLALTAGDNVSLVPDPNTKQIVIKAEDTKYTHPESGVSAGTYTNVTVDEQGHVVAGNNPTTLAGYGITDAEEKGAANSAVSAHNTATEAHNDIRLLITELTNRLNALANSDDETLDQTKEIVAYIKANRELIESITTSKVNVTDIINNLTTNVSNKPLSAAQGVAIKALIDALQEIVNGLESVKHFHSNSSVLNNTTASYTTEEKTKLSGVEEGANNYSLPAGLATGYVTTGQISGEALGEKATAEGNDTTASGNTSHAEGNYSAALGDYSHAEGGLSTSNFYGICAIMATPEIVNVETTAYSTQDSITQMTLKVTMSKSAMLAFPQNIAYDKVFFIFNNKKYTIRKILYPSSSTGTDYTIDLTLDNPDNVDLSSSFNKDTCFYSQTKASGHYSHAEGRATTASGEVSHAEGYQTTASGEYSHTEGNNAIASGLYSHAEGYYTTASGEASHAECYKATASGSYSHAEGYYTTVSGKYSHAEGYQTTVSGKYSHAEGRATTASVEASHAEGSFTKALASCTHAEGYSTTASGKYSHAEGQATTATNYASHVSGKFNKTMTDGGGESTQVGDVFVIGNGTDNSKLSNAFRVTYTGATYGLSAFNSSGADYAEFIYPWYDDNKDDEDRIGYFVTFKDGKLYKATSKDIILGITSGNPSIVGNADEDYYWKYERDEFNRIVFEDVEEEIEKVDENGNIILDENNKPVYEKTGKIIKNGRMKLNPDYDSSLQGQYIERKDRKEWDYVGMLGVIPIRDDGTCIPGQFCKCNDEGMATLATAEDVTTNRFTFIVLERVSDNVIKVKL